MKRLLAIVPRDPLRPHPSVEWWAAGGIDAGAVVRDVWRGGRQLRFRPLRWPFRRPEEGRGSPTLKKAAAKDAKASQGNRDVTRELGPSWPRPPTLNGWPFGLFFSFSRFLLLQVQFSGSIPIPLLDDGAGGAGAMDNSSHLHFTSRGCWHDALQVTLQVPCLVAPVGTCRRGEARPDERWAE